jgi:hypothetical protein
MNFAASEVRHLPVQLYAAVAAETCPTIPLTSKATIVAAMIRARSRAGTREPCVAIALTSLVNAVPAPDLAPLAAASRDCSASR